MAASEARDHRLTTNARQHSSDRYAASINSLIETAKLNDVDPQAWLAHIITRKVDDPLHRIVDAASSMPLAQA